MKKVHITKRIRLLIWLLGLSSFGLVSCNQYNDYDKAAVVWLASSIGNECLFDEHNYEYVTCELLDSLGISPLFGGAHFCE
jgi:hypothetical protein